jgi:hypothetical protein
MPPKPPEHKFQKKLLVSYEEMVKEGCHEKIVMARDFQKAVGEQRANDIMSKAAEERVVARVRRRCADSPINSMADFAALMSSFHDNEMGKSTQTIEVLESTPRKYSFIVRECLWSKVYRDEDAGDLGYGLECATDFIFAKTCNPKLRLERRKTLMQGDPCCEFTYTWED